MERDARNDGDPQSERLLEPACQCSTEDSIVGVGTFFNLVCKAVQAGNAVEQQSPSTMPRYMPSVGQYNQSNEGQELADSTIGRPRSTTEHIGKSQNNQHHLNKKSDGADQQEEKGDGDSREGDPEEGQAHGSNG